MIPGLELMACQDLAVPMEVMEHVVRVESSFNPYAIGVVGARLSRQPRTLEEAVATAASLERDGHNFSLGLAQVNRHNLVAQGLDSYEEAFAVCPNLAAGARILADCLVRAGGDLDRALSCYYSGNFSRGFEDGYVRKVRRSMEAAATGAADSLRRRRSAPAVPVVPVVPVAHTVPATPAAHARPGAPGTPAAPTTPTAPTAPTATTVPTTPAEVAPFTPRIAGPRAPPPPASDGDAAFVF